jgi:hypothetical protein
VHPPVEHGIPITQYSLNKAHIYIEGSGALQTPRKATTGSRPLQARARLFAYMPTMQGPSATLDFAVNMLAFFSNLAKATALPQQRSLSSIILAPPLIIRSLPTAHPPSHITAHPLLPPFLPAPSPPPSSPPTPSPPLPFLSLSILFRSLFLSFFLALFSLFLLLASLAHIPHTCMQPPTQTRW